MELSICKDGSDTFYYVGKVWSPKNHVGRVSLTAQGRYVAYNRSGDLLGTFRSIREGRAAIVAQNASEGV